MPKTKTNDKEEIVSQIRQKFNEANGILVEQAAKTMTNPKLLAQFLNLLGDHVTSSAYNAILVQAQMPYAKAIQTKAEWESVGVHIKRDSRGHFPKGIFQFKRSGEFIDKNGKVKTGYTVCKGYDVSQTEDPTLALNRYTELRGEKIVQPIDAVIGSDDYERIRNLQFCERRVCGCSVVWTKNGGSNLIDPAEHIPSGIRYIPETKTIVVKSFSRQSFMPNIVYEAVMAQYHEAEGGKFRRENHHNEAITTAYLTCRMAGCDTSVFNMCADGKTPADVFTPDAYFQLVNQCVEKAHEFNWRLQNALQARNNRVAETTRSSIVSDMIPARA